MKRIIALVIGMLSISPPAFAQWRTALTVAADAALWIDYSQIVRMRTTGQLVDEANPILGHYPSVARYSLYTAAWLGINTFVPRKARPWINIGTILVEIAAIHHQSRWVGIRLSP